ncbi:hypothetical protein LAZ67_1006570, partial [Cordylochernes scorpioides]
MSPKEIYEDMVVTLREDTPSYSTVKNWVAAFKLGRISTEDEHRPGRPVESVTQENIDKIHDLVMLDRRMTVSQIEETLGIPKTTVDRIMREHLGLRKLSALWVPKLLTLDQKAVRRKLSSDNLALFEANPEEFVNRIVTMDETWAHHFTPESKQQSMQWRQSGSSPPKKAKTVPSTGKVMVSVFWDSEGVLLLDFLNKGQTITGNYYANLVKQLREAIKEKRRFIIEKISGNTAVPMSRRYVRARQSYSNLFKGYTLRCGDFTMEQKLKQRICIEFCVKLQISATDTFEMLNKAFRNNAPKRTTVFEWHSRFKAGRISIEDDPRQGRPTFQRTDKNVQKITDLVKENPRTTLLELEQDTGISKTKIGRIVTEDLRLKKTPAKFIPRFLTNEQKLCRLATCEDMLEMTRTDPEWKDKIITGDETWVYGYGPETKRQSAEWRGQGEPRPKKYRILKSRNKVLLVAFLDNKGLVHHEYLPAVQTVIKEISNLYPNAVEHTVVDVLSRHPSPVPDVYDTDDHPDSDPAPLIAAAVVDPVDGSR